MVFKSTNINSKYMTDPEYREKANKTSREWRKKKYHSNPEQREKDKIRVILWNKKQKQLAIRHYTNGTMKCQCEKCDVKGINFLTIEHINGGGTKHRKEIKQSIYVWLRKNGYPKEFTVLCWNCNCSRGQFGYCHSKSL